MQEILWPDPLPAACRLRIFASPPVALIVQTGASSIIPHNWVKW